MVEAQTTTWEQERTLARHHSPAPGYVNSGMSIFSRRRFHPDPRQRAGCEGPPAPHLAVSRDLDPRQAQDRGGGLYQICTRLNRPPPINWHPRKPELVARGRVLESEEVVGRWAGSLLRPGRRTLPAFSPHPGPWLRLNWFPTRKDGLGTITGNFPLLPKYHIPSTKYQTPSSKY